MKNVKLALLVAMASVMVLAAAASAFASPPPDGTVYGQATMEPVVNLQLSGAGSISFDPLVYHGYKGDTVGEIEGREIHVANEGDEAVQLNLGYGSNPSDGSSTWAFADESGATECVWTFSGEEEDGVNVPALGAGDRALLESLAPGDSHSFASRFTFPTTYNGNTHNMTAIISAE